jgi:hypothetical protein
LADGEKRSETPSHEREAGQIPNTKEGSVFYNVAKIENFETIAANTISCMRK